MTKLNLGQDLYLKGRIGWQGLSKDEYLPTSNFKIINATALMDGYVDWNNCGYISEERYNEASDIQLKEKDILISKDGTLGKIGYVKNLTSPCSVAAGIFVLRNTRPDLVDFDYLYHILKSNIFKNFIHRNKALGSTISHLYQRDLNNFEIELPNLDVQKKVAKVLNNLDSKIANNISIISELESLAKTIYDYWFLQFEFPNEDGKPYKSSGGKMVWNEELKREIPEGWTYKSLSEIEACIVTGKTPSTKIESNFGGAVPFVTIDDLRGTMFVCETNRTLTKKGANTQKGKYLPANSLCVSCIGTIGLLGFTTKESQTNQQINSIVFEDEFNRMFLYFALSQHFANASVKSGNVFKNMNKDEFKNIKLIYPTVTVLKIFQKNTSSFEAFIKKCELENQELASLRDFLLPMLMNGQVTFKD